MLGSVCLPTNWAFTITKVLKDLAEQSFAGAIQVVWCFGMDDMLGHLDSLARAVHVHGL